MSGSTVRGPRSRILQSIATSGHTWFNSAFTGVGGISWLEQEIASTEDCYWYLQLAAEAVTQADSFVELVQWATCLQQCLSKGSVPGSPDKLRAMLLEQSKYRSPRTELNPSNKYNFVKVWSDGEWNEWREYLEWLITGLEKGHIISVHSHYILDPDGICSGRE